MKPKKGFKNGFSTPRGLMGEAMEQLQGRQREVYFLTMREEKSFAEVAEILGITETAAEVYRDQAIKYVESYCKVAIAKGRV